MRSVEAHIPTEVLLTDNVGREAQLDTAVADVTDVAVVTAHTEALRHAQPEQQVAGLLVVEVQATAQTTLQEAELKTDVQVGRGLPGDILVTQTREGRHDVLTVARQ